jgi:hypothetical protein
MVQIKAYQQVYAHVEKDQSPQGRGGFQTLLYSRPALSEAEVEALEGRLLYYPSEAAPVKRVFFTTATGRAAVAQIVPLAERDQHGRGGRYLAHNLVFDPADFARLDNDPFRVLDAFPFFTSVEEALAQGDFATGHLEPTGVEVAEEEPLAGEGWAPAEWSKLALLALRAPGLATERQAVACVGPPEDLLAALRAAFLCVPPPLRLHCSFDTYFHRCNLVATYFWAVGFPEPSRHPNFLTVDARQRRVEVEVDQTPRTPYERWLLHALAQNDWEAVSRGRAGAHVLTELLAGRPGDAALLSAAPPTLTADFCELNAADVTTRLRSLVADVLPTPLVESAFAEVRDLPVEETIARLQHGFTLAELAEVLYGVYARAWADRPAKAELAALAGLLQEVDHRPLRLLHAAWTGQHQALRQELATLSDEGYRAFVGPALDAGLARREELLVPGHGEALVDLCRPPLHHDPEGLVRLAQALLKAGEAEALEGLAEPVRSQSKKTLRALQGLAKRHPETPVAFCEALTAALTALPPKPGLVRRLLDRVRRKK